jgi:formate hydrogenlyase subunit 6/NADH:ubiquinone oxidoreductase subunit I
MWCPTRAIIGRRKNKHRIDSEKCIDCGVCGRVCGHHAIEDENGITQTRQILREWLAPVWDYQFCTSCNACIRSCPAKCIESASAEVGGYRALPRLRRINLCIACGACAAACKFEAIVFRRREEVAAA